MAALALGTASFGLAACGDDEKDKDSAAKATTLALTAGDGPGKTATFVVPPTAAGGATTVTLTNGSKGPRSAQLVRIDGNHSVDEVLKVVMAEGGPTPDWLHGAGGVGQTKPGTTGSATVALGPGNYVVFDTGDEETKLKPGGAAFKVQGGDAKADTGPADVTITAAEPSKTRYTLEAEGAKPGKVRLAFDNKGKELHHVILFPVAKGKTAADVTKALGSDQEPQGPPPFDPAGIQGTAVLDTEQRLVQEVDLKAGEYVMACFISDRVGGPPHAFKQKMLGSFKVA